MPNSCPIKHHILVLLGEDQIRMTPSDLAGVLHRKFPKVQRPALHQAIKEMVAEGLLVYTNHFSTTHLELNFNQPVRVSDRVIVCPANSLMPKKSNTLIIKLQDGAAFGIGDHPTTRLCIQGLDYTLARQRDEKKMAAMTALDIGTGSAVLALAAVGLGVAKAVGVDIDPLACNEAKSNVALNGMTDRITITNAPLDEKVTMRPNLILANLRPPTLKRLFAVMEKISKLNAIWVLSGFRKEEEKGVERLLPSRTARVIWRSHERGWAAMVVGINQNNRTCDHWKNGAKHPHSAIGGKAIVQCETSQEVAS